MVSASVTKPPVLELSAASCRFDALTALRPVSLRVDQGTTCLLHGANGSGKTTLLRVCAGLLAPSSGERRATGRCLYLRPGSGTRRRQTVREVLATVAVLSGRGKRPVAECLEAAGLVTLAGRRVETLSSGQRGRLLVGMALAARPAVACLDEPTAHLDTDGSALVRAGMRRLAAAGTAVLVATHDHDLLGDDPDARLVLHDGTVTEAA